MTSYFAEFVNFVGAQPHYALTAVLLLALSEAIPVIGTVLPGSTLPRSLLVSVLLRQRLM